MYVYFYEGYGSVGNFVQQFLFGDFVEDDDGEVEEEDQEVLEGQVREDGVLGVFQVVVVLYDVYDRQVVYDVYGKYYQGQEYDGVGIIGGFGYRV